MLTSLHILVKMPSGKYQEKNRIGSREYKVKGTGHICPFLLYPFLHTLLPTTTLSVHILPIYNPFCTQPFPNTSFPLQPFPYTPFPLQPFPYTPFPHPSHYNSFHVCPFPFGFLFFFSLLSSFQLISSLN